MSTNQTEKVPHSTAMEYRRRICLAMNFICDNLGREMTLEEIAKSAAFSMFHFHRIFKTVVGETVAEFTRRLRLEMAANKLLLDRHGLITDIALDCGFSSSQNFAKAFRQYFGLTPSAYRKSKNCHIVSKGENAASLRSGYILDPVFIDSKNSANQGGLTMHAEVREMPEYYVAYVRKMGPYGKETCEQAFAELMQWAGPEGHLASGVLLAIYWDNPEVTAPEKCRVDACVGVAKNTATRGQIGMQTISGGPHAVCRFELRDDGFHQAWEDAFVWLVNSGYECDDRPSYELYHNTAEEHPEGKWIIDICIPLRKK
ncbi:MAG: AraC family transcriptional regulator [Proteobacteria bacterium]|nr:AraC family transcriptional regulator [Pseudomonadota bacterium]